MQTLTEPRTTNGERIKSGAQWTTSAAVVHRIGRELIKDPLTAFFELVKNSYDADATEVHVRFHKTTSAAGKIVIRDNGSGMSERDIRRDYFRVAGEQKVREEFSPRFHRRRLGAKGIGRFSAHKLGDLVKVKTRERGQPRQLVFTLDAGDFTDDRDLEDVVVPIVTGTPQTGFAQGTIIEISKLSEGWGKREIKKIRSQLCGLISPDQSDQNFSVTLECPAHPDLSGRLESPIAGKESHTITFSIDADGQHECEVMKSGENGSPKPTRQAREPNIAGPIRGVLRYYKEGLRTRDRRLAAGTDESHMGVKVYRDSCRVRPYGEASDDWLRIKSRKAAGGGKFYVKPLAIAGSVHISATANPELRDATDREGGMDENLAFKAFREFVDEHVRLLNRLLEQETRSESQRRKRQTLKKILDTVIECLSKKESEVYRDYVEKVDRAKPGPVDRRRDVRERQTPEKDEWHCRDCDARWRVLRGDAPTVCSDLAVNRKGQRRRVEGCGSSNIERSKHVPPVGEVGLGSVISGKYALVGGKQISLRVDYEMGANEDEYTVDGREIVINGSHPAFEVAERLDGISGQKYEIGDDSFVPALTVHITKCASLAWGELHYTETKNWEEYKARYDDLLDTICSAVQQQLSA